MAYVDYRGIGGHVKREIILSHEDVQLLYKAIGKWEAIALGCGVDKGADNCVLCKKYWDGICNDCPISKAAGNPYCRNTPYVKFTRLARQCYDCGLYNWYYAHTEEAKIAALDMANYMREIIAKGIIE